MSSPRAVLALLLVAPVVAVAAGCGGSDSKGDSASTSSSKSSVAKTTKPASGSAGGAGAVALAADPGGALKFDKTKLSAKAGKVTIDLKNASQVPHGVAIEGQGVDKDSKIVSGSSTTVSATLKPGTYEFYCPVPGHKAAGMKGTLTVK